MWGEGGGKRFFLDDIKTHLESDMVWTQVDI